MFIMMGSKMYGKVDRVPGVCHVVTKFGHLNFIPLLPVSSFIVVEGSEAGGEFKDKQIGLSFKSVLAGYLRAWLGAAVIILGTFAEANLFKTAKNAPEEIAAIALLIVMGVTALLSLFSLSKSGFLLQALAHLASVGLFLLFDPTAQKNPEIRDAMNLGISSLVLCNFALLIYGLTRFLQHASKNRSRQLLDELGLELPPEEGEEELVDRWQGWDEEDQRRR